MSILQESAITASVSNETKIIEILESGGDLHSEVARSCWPDILGSYTDKEIKEKFLFHILQLYNCNVIICL